MHVLLLVAVVATVGVASCTAHDKALYRKNGKHYETAFRKLGGMFVFQGHYEELLVKQHGLSPQCARCYGDAYTCGRSNCKWACRSAGERCNECLAQHKCIERCDKCTNYY